MSLPVCDPALHERDVVPDVVSHEAAVLLRREFQLACVGEAAQPGMLYDRVGVVPSVSQSLGYGRGYHLIEAQLHSRTDCRLRQASSARSVASSFRSISPSTSSEKSP